MGRRLKRALAGLLAMLCACAPVAGVSSSPAVESFCFSRASESVEQARSYRIAETARGRFAWIELYGYYYLVLPVTDGEMDAFSDLVEELGLADWDGFSESDPDALDGEHFSLSAAFSDGSALTACGSNRFPADYWDAAARIESFFQSLMESCEIDIEQTIL